MRIAIADDKPDVISFLKTIVEEQDHEAVGFADGDSLSQALTREEFDLLILDWGMRGKDGPSMLRWMDSTLAKRPPVIMMANRSAKKDISDALGAGADDYITKPEDRAVVAARIAAMLRGNVGPSAFDVQATYGGYVLNRIEHRVAFHGRDIALTAKEFALTDLLFRNADRTLSRSYIMETIWRTKADLATRTLDMHISRIRSKLQLQPANGFRIFTVFGYGYRLETIAKSN